MTGKRKFGIIAAAIIVIGAAAFVYFKFFFVFGVGVKNGTLNYVVHKGYLFKTYEGKMIQTGFQTTDDRGIQSNEFLFSVTDQEVATELMRNQGNEVWLHYKEYLGRLPWRGYSKYIVDSVVVIDRRQAPESLPMLPVQ